MKTVDLVKEYLSNEGFRYEVDSDGDIHFRYEGAHIYYIPDDDDQSYFRLLMPGIYDLRNDRAKVFEAMNAVSAGLKVVKPILGNDTVHLSIELFLDLSPEIEDFFPRCLNLLMHARSKFMQEMLQ